MNAGRPLPNRVDPYGALVAVRARGALMGNRGGRFHRDDGALGSRRWVSERWIACLCAFRGRRREVWGRGYTEVFFLDEPTALAAGHRPCFECRRAEAEAFRRAFDESGRTSAAAIDRRLHRERLAHFAGRFEARALDELSDGVMVERAGAPFAVRGDALLPWSFFGYGASEPRPRAARVRVLTPPSIVRALASGYRPRWAEAARIEEGGQ
jgi:hypothetical protein